MKGLFSFGVLILIVGTALTAHGESCTPADCVEEPCITGGISFTMLEGAIPGGWIRLHVRVKNKMSCTELVTVRIRYKYHDEQSGQKVAVEAKRRWLAPDITIPLTKRPGFNCEVDLPLPDAILPGKYVAIMTIEGENSGVLAKAKKRFTVCETYPCSQ